MGSGGWVYQNAVWGVGLTVSLTLSLSLSLSLCLLQSVDLLWVLIMANSWAGSALQNGNSESEQFSSSSLRRIVLYFLLLLPFVVVVYHVTCVTFNNGAFSVALCWWRVNSASAKLCAKATEWKKKAKKIKRKIRKNKKNTNCTTKFLLLSFGSCFKLN